MQDRLSQHRIFRSKKSVLLLGPRQVGKSTLLRSLSPDLTIDLADEEAFIAHAKDAGLLKRTVEALKKNSPVILIDEIQRITPLLNTVQSLIDRGPGLRFLLSGSSARKLKAGGANLLPGRVILEYLDPLSLLEIGKDFDLRRALRLGMLPGIYWDEQDAEAVLGTYAEVYLREEIRGEALLKDLGGYARFLDLAALSSGQWLNYSKLSSDSGIPKETIRRYVSILEDTLLMFRMPAFRPRTHTNRRVAQKDKIFFFDLGVRNALLGLHKHPVDAERMGSLFEQWVVLQVITLNRALQKGWALSSYRSEGGAEVDLVIERERDIIGLEIKASKNIGRSDLKGLESLGDLVGKKKPYIKRIAYLGTLEQKFDTGAIATPYQSFFEALRDD
jgi:predicted AAA+ superfamily ATPase